MLKLLDKYEWYDADINTNGNDPTSAKTCICFTIDTFNKLESNIEQEVQDLKLELEAYKRLSDISPLQIMNKMNQIKFSAPKRTD